MAESENKELVRRCFEELVNGKDLRALERYCAADFHDFDPPAGGPGGGVDAVRRAFQQLFRALPDLRGDIEEIVAEDDRVFVRTTFAGTQHGVLLGLLPTGRRLEYELWHLFRVSDGKIREHRAQADTLELLAQIGASPKQMADAVQART